MVELKANIDDMTGEALGFAMDRLMDQGAYLMEVDLAHRHPVGGGFRFRN